MTLWPLRRRPQEPKVSVDRIRGVLNIDFHPAYRFGDEAVDEVRRVANDYLRESMTDDLIYAIRAKVAAIQLDVWRRGDLMFDTEAKFDKYVWHTWESRKEEEK